MGPGGDGLDPSQDVPLKDITTPGDGQSERDAETVVRGKSDYRQDEKSQKALK